MITVVLCYWLFKADCHSGNQIQANFTFSDELLLHTRFNIQRILTPIVVLVGIIGNLITIIVLSQRRMKSSTNVYLRALAVSDSLYLISSFLLSLQHYDIHDIKYKLYWKMAPFFFWHIDASSGTSTWLTVSFALERYIAVCHPLRGRVLCTESRARKVIFGVAAFNILTTVTTSFEWDLCVTNKTAITLKQNSFGSNETYQFVYYWFTAIVFCYIPLALLCVLNTFLVLAVRNSQKQRNGLTQINRGGISHREKQENKITMALVAVVLLFIVCQTPTTILLIMSIFHPPSQWNKDFYNYHRVFSNICNFLMCVNAATNFLLYCAMSDKYRKTFVLTFLPCVSKHHRTLTLSSMNSHRSSRSLRRSTRHAPSKACIISNKKKSTLRPPAIHY